MNKELFLISSSRCANDDYLAHCKEALKSFLGPIEDGRIAFIPYALNDHDAYASKAIETFATMGYVMDSVHNYSSDKYLIYDKNTKAVFVGGGNTFLLRKELEERGLLRPIRDAVEYGTLKYIGSSAGTVVACPTIKTTNDMPIVQPSNFDAFKFINFQINAHFVSGSLLPGHMGETRETRIHEYHEHNDLPVVGLTETNWLTVNREVVTLHGEKEAYVFEKNKKVRMWKPETEFILSE